MLKSNDLDKSQALIKRIADLMESQRKSMEETERHLQGLLKEQNEGLIAINSAWEQLEAYQEICEKTGHSYGLPGQLFCSFCAKPKTL